MLCQACAFACEKKVVPIIQTDSNPLNRILAEGCIKPVFQPIVSLQDGRIFGYEALSRVSNSSIAIGVEQLFRLADKADRAWDLETLCRAKALAGAANIAQDKLLFLNVNPNIIYDAKFNEGFTKRHLGAYGIRPENVVFEITERVAVLDRKAFLVAIQHYRNQQYGIAIDDVGAGYSGLKTIADVKPNLMKMDMSLVRNIDKDEIKQLLCKAMVDFGKSANISLIAEGIETEEELKTVITLGVDYGQGFFLGIPQDSFLDIAEEKKEVITRYQSKRYFDKIKSSVYPVFGNLFRPGYIYL